MGDNGREANTATIDRLVETVATQAAEIMAVEPEAAEIEAVEQATMTIEDAGQNQTQPATVAATSSVDVATSAVDRKPSVAVDAGVGDSGTSTELQTSDMRLPLLARPKTASVEMQTETAGASQQIGEGCGYTRHLRV